MQQNKRWSVITVFITACSLNFLWESFHAPWLYVLDLAPKQFVSLIAYASAVDALFITIMYLAVAMVWRDLAWIQKPIQRQLILFSTLGLIIAIAIEYKALYIFNQWSYSSLMPTIFTLGVSPLVQLSLTGLASLWIARRMA